MLLAKHASVSLACLSVLLSEKKPPHLCCPNLNNAAGVSSYHEVGKIKILKTRGMRAVQVGHAEKSTFM